MFNRVLCTPYPQIRDKNQKATLYFDSQKAIRNVIQYFKFYGVDLSGFNTDTDFLYHSIETLLSVIVISICNGDKFVVEAENIEQEFYETIHGIRADVNARKALVVAERERKIKELHDSEYLESECDFRIDCIGLQPTNVMSKVNLIYPLVATIHYPIQPDSQESNFYLNYFLSDLTDFNLDSRNLLDKKNQYYHIRKAIGNAIVRLVISGMLPDMSFLNCKEYKFSTYLDEKVIYQLGCMSSEDLKIELHKKAQLAIEKELQDDYVKYCHSVMTFLEDVFKRAFSLDFCEIMAVREKSIEENKKILSEIVLNSGQLFSALNEYEAEPRAYTEQTYLIIQNIVLHITKMLKMQGSFFCKEFKEKIDSKNIKGHISRIKRFISNQLAGAINMESELETRNPDLYKEPESIDELFTYRIPHLMKDLKSALDEYLSELKKK